MGISDKLTLASLGLDTEEELEPWFRYKLLILFFERDGSAPVSCIFSLLFYLASHV